MRIAYLVNVYPKISHSFVRREILELERKGFEIQRIDYLFIFDCSTLLHVRYNGFKPEVDSMSDELLLLEKPRSKKINMIVGWRQWADGGSVSSGLPQYLIGKTKAYKIGAIASDGFR